MLQTLQQMVVNLDWDAIEDHRSTVTSFVSSLVSLYTTLSWPQKVAFIQLVQDQSDDCLQDAMVDILRAPLNNAAGVDNTQLTQAAALCYLDKSHDKFMDYYKDRGLLADAVAATLAERSGR